MLLYCPICSNSLAIVSVEALRDTLHPGGRNCMECRTCPFRYVIPARAPYFERKAMRPKEVEDVLGGKQAWENADQTSVQCPNDDCDGDRAYYRQAQLRSADEPMTTFFLCTKCFRPWREG